MKSINRLVFAMILILPSPLSAQESPSLLNDSERSLLGKGGIKWTEGLSWEQVKQKAKRENMYVFLDCYTTWCGPCKMMDNSVYLSDSVGDYFNNKFISVKVQMDKTIKDNSEIKSWYTDADSIAKLYHVEGYPCFIFLSPQGKIVHKAMGFTPVAEFIKIAKIATVPGKIYSDEFVQFDDFIKAYKNGKREYDRYPVMIKTAFKVHDTAMGFQLMRDLLGYMEHLPTSQRYTKDRIEMWTTYGIPSKSKVFQFFYKDGKIIDKVMGAKGYAAEIVDRTIQNEICIPFLEAQSKGIAMRGMYLNSPGLKSDHSEADWQKLHQMINKKFGLAFAKRATLTARIEWYNRHRNHVSFVQYSLMQFKKYSPDLSSTESIVRINSVSWHAFLYVVDKKTLKECLPWIKKAINRLPFGGLVDTYANLLYKVGRIEEALEWQKKAVSLAPADKRFKAALEDMKQGKPTHGAVWQTQTN